MVTDLRLSAFTGPYTALVVQLVLPLVAYELWLYKSKGDDTVFSRSSAIGRGAITFGICAVTVVFLIFHRSLVQAEVPFIYFQF
jgi:hypothetical protein